MIFPKEKASATSNDLFLVTSNKQILQQVTGNFLQRATSATSNKPILQRVTSEFQ